VARAASSKGKKKSRFRLWKAAVWALAFLLLFPFLQVLAVRYIDPPLTPPMLLSRMHFRSGHRPAVPYRWTDLEKVSPWFLKAVWQTEDARFFSHNGFDWIELDHAVANAQRTGKPPRGASTITMQCARSLFLWQGRSWLRKPIEAYYTILLETMLTKRRIFELYVNVIEFGEGLYGIEAAAQHYWHLPAQELDREKAALLTAILPNPQARDPLQPSEVVRAKTLLVIRKLAQSPRWPL